jgi:site-specific recombinase XerD
MDIRISERIHNYLKYQENFKTFSPHSLKAYKTDLEQAFENKLDLVCSAEDLWGHSRGAIQIWAGLSLSSRNRKIATLKSFFNWLFEEKQIQTNYSNQLICPKVPKKIPHFISVDEVIAILKYLAGPFHNDESQKKAYLQKTLFLILYGSGLRISEACNLKWKQINLAEQKILVHGKGNKERYSVIPNFCVEHLKYFQKKFKTSESLFVFGETAMNPRTGFELIRTLGAAAGLTNNLHPHALRHSYATHLLASGTNLRTLQMLLGHDSLQATEKYTHLSVDHLARLVEKTHPLTKLKLSS